MLGGRRGQVPPLQQLPHIVPAPGFGAAARPARRRDKKSCGAKSSGGGAYLLDYGAGNVRSVRNACKRLGYHLNEVQPPARQSSTSLVSFQSMPLLLP